MDLYVFNPDTDLALANNEENYMAPASARRMAQDLALLPVWYARPGSAVLAPSAYHADFLKRMKELFPLSVELVTEPELPDYAGAQIVPWGWNPAFRKRMLKGGLRSIPFPACGNWKPGGGLPDGTPRRRCWTRSGVWTIVAVKGLVFPDFRNADGIVRNRAPACSKPLVGQWKRLAVVPRQF